MPENQRVPRGETLHDGDKPLYVVVVRVGGYDPVHRVYAARAQERDDDPVTGVFPQPLVRTTPTTPIHDKYLSGRAFDDRRIPLPHVQKGDAEGAGRVRRGAASR